MMELPSKLSPAVKFALACLNPAAIRSPFVENGMVSDIPTQTLVGNTQLAVTPATINTANVGYVLFSPLAGYVYGGGSGVEVNWQPDTTTSLTAAALSGVARTTLFGVLDYADKLIPWAGEALVEIIAPSATLQGVAHVGSIPSSSFNGGITIAQLITRATERHDLKTGQGKIIRLRTAIQNTSSIHTLTGGGLSLATVADEYVSYVIYQTAAASLTTGSPGSYNINVGVQFQCVWWPDGATPALAGVGEATKVEPESEITSSNTAVAERQALMKDIAEENAIALRRINHVPTVPNMTKLIATCVANASVDPVIKEMDFGVSPASAPLSGARDSLSSPLIQSPMLVDDANTLSFYSTRECRHLSIDSWSQSAIDLYDSMCETRQTLINELQREITERNKLHDRIQRARQEISWVHGRRVVTYLDDDGIIDLEKALEAWECDSVSYAEPPVNFSMSVKATPDKARGRPS